MKVFGNQRTRECLFKVPPSQSAILPTYGQALRGGHRCASASGPCTLVGIPAFCGLKCHYIKRHRFVPRH